MPLPIRPQRASNLPPSPHGRLQEFVGSTPWAHVDMAGPVWSDKKGATGFGVKLLVDWLHRQP